VTDALRLAVGTLTALPVRPPRRVDRAVAATALSWAPAVGLLLGVTAELVVLTVRWAVPGLTDRLLAAALALAVLAVLTRGLHLDGLADTADGLGSGRRGAAAVEVMQRPDVGAFGVVTVVLTLLVQVAALDTALLRGRGTVALVGGVVVARLALTWSARSGLAAASGSRLGATVAGSVGPFRLAAVTVLTAGGLSVLGWWEDDEPTTFVFTVLLAAAVALLASQLLVRHCVKRFDGVTGDVMGAAAEIAFATFAIAVCVH
jgi:adenosylcobinamide-GDP ribazoletransferase